MNKNNNIWKASIVIVFLSIVFSTNAISIENNRVEIVNTSSELISTNYQESPWPMFRHDLKNTGYTPYTGPSNPTLAWNYTVNDGITSSPSIGSDGTIYFGSGLDLFNPYDTKLYALNPEGSLKWSYQTTGGIFSSPALGPNNTIYFTSYDHCLYAIEDLGTHANLTWKIDLGLFLLSSPAIAPDGTIYVGSPNFYFFAINPNGTVKWLYETDWCIISSPAIVEDGTIYVGSKDHYLYAFDDEIEGPKWSFPAGVFYDGHLVDSSPAVGEDGTIYFGTDQYGAFGQDPIPVNTSFWAINPDGSLKWSFDTEDGVESSPAIGPDGTIYFGSYDNNLYAVKDVGNQGILQWKFETNDSIDGSPAVDGDGVIYFGSRDNIIYALNPNGTIKWTYETNGDLESSPSIDGNGYLYIGSFDSNLYCIGTGNPDAGVVSIDMPPQVLTNTSITPTATVRNFRSTEQTFNVNCIIKNNDIIIYNDTQQVILGDKEIKEVIFSIWNVGSGDHIEHKVTVTTMLENDDNNINDKISFDIVSVYDYLCGNVNGISDVDIDDVVYLINYIFSGGPPPTPIECIGDANGENGVDIDDVVYLIQYIFSSGPPPVENCCLEK